MPEAADKSYIGRRDLLRIAIGSIVASIVPIGARLAGAATPEAAAPPDWTNATGAARWRIDGPAKVRGTKLYARDLRPADIAGWPSDGLHAKMIGARFVDRPFVGLDFSRLPDGAKPDVIALGPQPPGTAPAVLHASSSPAIAAPMLRPSIVRSAPRDLITAESEPRWYIAGIRSPFDKDPAPLIVPQGAVPNFFGQPLAFLLFRDPFALRRAADALRFDENFIRTGQAGSLTPPRDLTPSTYYVRAHRGAAQDFSYATVDSDRYRSEAKNVEDEIRRMLASSTAPPPIERRYTTSAQDPFFMEPEAALGWFDPTTGTLHLVLATQSPDHDLLAIQGMLENETGFDLRRIELITCLPGGGFGGRDQTPFVYYIATLAILAKGTPVRLSFDRFDQFQAGLKRQASQLRGSLRLHDDGRILALDAELRFDAGGRANLSPYVAGLAALAVGGAYEVPYAIVNASAKASTEIQAGSQRGFGGPEGFLVVETLLDEAAARSGRDPITLRRLNLLREGERTIAGSPIAEDLRLSEILDRVEAHPLWRDRHTGRPDGRRYGVGFAMSMQAYGTSGDAVLAEVSIDAAGAVTVRSNAVDMGNGSATTLGVATADLLGEPARVVTAGDATLWPKLGLTTEGNDWSNPRYVRKSTSSSSACLTAFHQVHAVRTAARVVFETAVLPAAARLWRCEIESLSAARWRDGALVNADRVPLPRADVMRAAARSGAVTGALVHAYFQGGWVEADYAVDGQTYRWPLTGLTVWRGARPETVMRANTAPPTPDSARYARTTYAPSASLVAVEVDDGGNVRVAQVVTVLNAGPLITPALVEGQSYGALSMALGYTLSEAALPGPEGPGGGQWNLDRYTVPLARDLPWRTHELICLPPRPGEPSRGIAEAVLCSIPAATLNALAAATSSRFIDLPVTPQAIRKALQT